MYVSPVKLKLANVPVRVKGIAGYKGRKYSVCVQSEKNIEMDAGLWSGGQRDMFYISRQGSHFVAPQCRGSQALRSVTCVSREGGAEDFACIWRYSCSLHSGSL